MTRLYLAVTLSIAALLRFWRLDQPAKLVFDEIYYVDGARDYLKSGVELDGAKAEFVVHPPFGKWLIAIGIKLFGDNPLGWRVSAAVVGTISVLLIFLIARKLFNSDFIALCAALLTTIDGLHLVMSRVALLDIFLMALMLAGFLTFLYDRNFLTAIFLGLALATKWSALYIIVALVIYLFILKREKILIYLVTIPPIYLATWLGWFNSNQGYDRNFSSNPLLSLIEYHRKILQFHTNLSVEHPYEASPWNWLFLGRPTSFFYETPKCGGANCSQEILAMGTPVIWWAGLISILLTLGYFISRRDRVAGLIALGFSANYLPWLFFPERTTFYFYAIAFQPFLILAICYAIQLFLASGRGGRYSTVIVQSSIALAALCFAYFLPIYLATTLSYEAWLARMWFPSWI